jgi:DNA-binding CsgD family transcriptional regulator
MNPRIALLERDEELARLGRVLDGALAGGGRLALVEGEAGAGKTSLLEAVGEEAAGRGMLVLKARGNELERDFPYGVMRQLLEPVLLPAGGRSERWSGGAALAAPVFASDSSGPLPADPFGTQHGLYWLVADLAESQPLLILVDDAQWADRASLRALAYIAHRVDSLPAALVLAVRSGEPDAPADLLDALRHEPGSTLVSPSPLSGGAVAALLAGELGAEPSEVFVEACHRATAGNPFLLGELLRTVGAEGLDPAEGSVERVSRAAAAGASAPILARLNRLGEAAAAVAQATAVLEPTAEIRAVASLSDLPVETVARESDRLIAAGLLADARPLSFVHPLVREAVYAEVSAPLRAEAHARAARLLDEGGAAEDTVAAHVLLAEPVADEWVVDRLRAAAAGALGRGVPEAATSYLRRALAEPPPAPQRPALERELGAALLRNGDAEGIAVMGALREKLTEAAPRAEIAAMIAGSLGYRDRTQEAVESLRESLAELDGGDGRLAAFARGQILLQVLFGLERIPEGVMPVPGERLGNGTTEERLLLEGVAFVLALGYGSIAAARELVTRMVEDPSVLAADAEIGVPHHRTWGALAMVDLGDVAEPLYEPALEMARRRGSLDGFGAGLGARAYGRALDGDLREAQADAERAVSISHRAGFSAALANWASVLLMTMVARGQMEAAEALLAELGLEEEVGPGFPGASILCVRGDLHLARGRHAEARADFVAAGSRLEWLPLANPELFGWRSGLARAEAALGNRGPAVERAEEAVERAREAGGPRGIGAELRVQGALTGGGEGIEILTEAVRLLAATRARLQHARALVDLGAALRRANRRQDAREPLREGLDLARRCGAAPLEERARTELAASGARPRRAALSGVESLTPSELRVARLADDGMTNREIAESLFVTPKTVETHLRHVYQKLAIGGRAELSPALAAGESP